MSLHSCPLQTEQDFDGETSFSGGRSFLHRETSFIMNKLQGKKKKKDEEEEEREIPPELWKLIIEQYKRQLAMTDIMKVSETVKL